jgi:hypothetical protein
MVKSDYIRKISLMVGEEKYTVIGEFQELITSRNSNVVDGCVSVVGKPTQDKYEKTFE